MDTIISKHVFMSYSRRDEAVMRNVVGFLRARGINVWVDNEGLVPGTPVWEVEIEKAIQEAGAVVILLSPDSNQSIWVRREISYAERYQKRIFPILVAGDENSSINLRLVTSQYVDIRKNKTQGLNSLCSAISSYLGNQEVENNSEDKERNLLRRTEKKTEIATLYPRWIAVIWLIIGWAISWEMGWMLSSQVVDITQWDIVVVGFTVTFAFDGSVIALTLWSEHILIKWKNVFAVILGWTLGGAIGGISGEIVNATVGGTPRQGFFWIMIMFGMFLIGGLFNGLVLRYKNVLKNWKNVLWMALGWLMSEVLNQAVEFLVGGAISASIRGAISGGVGGVLMILVIRRSLKTYGQIK